MRFDIISLPFGTGVPRLVDSGNDEIVFQSAIDGIDENASLAITFLKLISEYPESKFSSASASICSLWKMINKPEGLLSKANQTFTTTERLIRLLLSDNSLQYQTW